MIGYKVVRKKDNTYYSINQSATRVWYKLGKKEYVTPEYPFFIYDNIASAKDFLDSCIRTPQLFTISPNNKYTILKCEYSVVCDEPIHFDGLSDKYKHIYCCIIEPITEIKYEEINTIINLYPGYKIYYENEYGKTRALIAHRVSVTYYQFFEEDTYNRWTDTIFSDKQSKDYLETSLLNGVPGKIIWELGEQNVE